MTDTGQNYRTRYALELNDGGGGGGGQTRSSSGTGTEEQKRNNRIRKVNLINHGDYSGNVHTLEATLLMTM